MAKMAIITQKGVAMQTVTASQIKKNSTLLQNALRDDLLVTKRNIPYVVVLDYKRYRELIGYEMAQATFSMTPKSKEGSLTRQFAGIFADSAHANPYDGDIDRAIDTAYHQAMIEKYGHTDA
jgi:hypothetical protein